MKKKVSLEHLDTGKRMNVIFEVAEEGDHWMARLVAREEGEVDVKAPTFYGTSQEQAERQLRKVFEKEYELAGETVIEG